LWKSLVTQLKPFRALIVQGELLAPSLALKYKAREELNGIDISTSSQLRIINYNSKKFYITCPEFCGQFYKTFVWCNLCCFECIALSFDSVYAARGVDNAKKGCMKLTPGACTIKLFMAVIVAISY
jgi:hypothetical protein